MNKLSPIMIAACLASALLGYVVYDSTGAEVGIAAASAVCWLIVSRRS